jgi:hypothetical protein
MSIVKEIYQFDSGGIIYKDATGEILGTGTAGDSAAPDPGDLEGIFIYCQSPARTLYTVADTPITYRVKNGFAITTTPTRDQFLTILSQNFFFRVTGGAGAQDLDSVLTIGNNAGANDIDMNGKDITNAYKVFTEFVNGMPLINLELNSDNDIILNPNGKLIFNFFYTVELMDALTVDFYAPFDLKINSVSNLVNSPVTTILDDGAAYTLGNTILAGSKITVTVNTAAVVNLTTIQI